MSKKKVIVYGIGKFYREMEEKINEMYEVVSKVDRNLNEQERIVSLDEALLKYYDEVIITIENIGVCFEVVAMLIEKYDIPSGKIKLGLNLKESEGEYYLDVSPEGRIILKTNNVSIMSKNIDEFANVRGIFFDNCYNYYLGENSREIVIDIGMNIGGASLYFANKSNVMKVYGFEPFPETFAQAKENFELNDGIKERIESFPYGISDVNEIRQIIYNKNMTCGQSTDVKSNLKARINYKSMNLISENDDIEVNVKVKDIKDILFEIYKLHKQEDIILKIDCEGEEYRILKRIDASCLFNRIRMIILEWHYNGEESILEIFKKNQYVYFDFREGDRGMIYAFREK